jgi:hypothetical protein
MSLKAIVDGKMICAPFIDIDTWRSMQANKPHADSVSLARMILKRVTGG